MRFALNPTDGGTDDGGENLPQATAVLQTSRLTLGTLTPTESSQSNIDKVVNQRPSSHTQVAQDTPVNLQIGIVLLALAFAVNGILTWAQQHGPGRQDASR